MKIPYSQVHAEHGIIFAARSGQIHTFSLQDGSLVSTWKHPDVDKVADAAKSNAKDEKSGRASAATKMQPPSAEDEEPPAKRQKTTSEEDVSASKINESVSEDGKDPSTSQRKGVKKGKGNTEDNQGRTRRAQSIVPDRPIITHLTTTTDGKHLLAVTGHDKAIWVFEHDGEGHLKQISQRAMPKRPSSVIFTPDSTILCADKFGDVYSMPLIPDGAPVQLIHRPTPKPRAEPAGSELTVHSRRNLAALKDQQKQLEKARISRQDADAKLDVPSFELTLLLGHVSMLTAMTLAESEGRRYILTADRDEHIRVSRYIPQAHIIESFCLGHKEFISALTIPSSRGEVLVSGGGDADLFVWNWQAGAILSRTSVLFPAQQIKPEITKVAISNLHSFVYPTESGDLTYILATCEEINAIFSWKLTDDNALNHPGVIQLPGNPINLTLAPIDGSPPKLIVAIDPGNDSIKGLNVFSLVMNDGRLAVDTASHVQEDTVGSEDLNATEEEVKDLLYGIENLRKQKGDREDAEGGGEAGLDVSIS